MLEHSMLLKGILQSGVGLEHSEFVIDEPALLLLVCSIAARHIEYILIKFTGSE